MGIHLMYITQYQLTAIIVKIESNYEGFNNSLVLHVDIFSHHISIGMCVRLVDCAS